MAKMYFTDEDSKNKTTLGLYSERGVMSWFMFVYLPGNLASFLKELKFPKGTDAETGKDKPFSEYKPNKTKAIIYSELNLGNVGFGSPDGAIFLNTKPPKMLFLEVKINESYDRSCASNQKDSFNSSIQGQLQLKWRFVHTFFDSESVEPHEAEYVREHKEHFKKYQKKDVFYKGKKIPNEESNKSWRRLKISDGVEDFLKNLGQCKDNVYFVAITDENENPFDKDNYLPECIDKPWDQAKKHFCWAPTKILTQQLEDK